MYGTPGERALDARERATSRGCLAMMKSALADIMSRVLGEEEEELVIGRSDGDHVAEKPSLDDADRLARDFLDDPAEVLRKGCYAMTTSAAFQENAITQTGRLPADRPGGPDYYLVDQARNAAVFFYARHPSYPGARHLEVGEAEEEGAKKVCFLPWEDSKLTYRKLDDDADLVLTGPLNGCSVFVVEVTGDEDGKDTYLFHVNANAGRDGHFVAAQRAKFEAALERLWPDSGRRTLTHRLDFSGYGSPVEDVTAEAIVYGTRSGGGEWTFFFYAIDVDGSGNCTRRSGTPHPLPREAPG